MLNYNSEKENKAKVAVALAYNPGDDAPTVLASGKGALAERITKAASENDIPVYEDEKLANIDRVDFNDDRLRWVDQIKNQHNEHCEI